MKKSSACYKGLRKFCCGEQMETGKCEFGHIY